MIGIIGGGKMGEAILKGLMAKGKRVKVCEVDKSRLEYIKKEYNVETTSLLEELLVDSGVVIIAVKPQNIEDVLKGISSSNLSLEDKLFISIAAGVKISDIEAHIGKDKKVVRVMPNACAFVGESMSAIAFNSKVKEKDIETAIDIFSAIGETVIVKECLMNAITALSGSGPGFLAVIFEAFCDGAVFMGLSRELAEKLFIQTVKGTVKLFEKGGKSFSDIKSMVSSPSGTTISGIFELENRGIRGAIMSCLKKAKERGDELMS